MYFRNTDGMTQEEVEIVAQFTNKSDKNLYIFFKANLTILFNKILSLLDRQYLFDLTHTILNYKSHPKMINKNPSIIKRAACDPYFTRRGQFCTIQPHAEQLPGQNPCSPQKVTKMSRTKQSCKKHLVCTFFKIMITFITLQ